MSQVLSSMPAAGFQPPLPKEADTRLQRVAWVLWPSFIVAAVAELFLFAVFDPEDLHIFGVPVEADRMTIYGLGFFCLWAICAASASLTVFLTRSPWEVNRCPLDPTDRPPGCPKRETDEVCVDCGEAI